MFLIPQYVLCIDGILEQKYPCFYLLDWRLKTEQGTSKNSSLTHCVLSQLPRKQVGGKEEMIKDPVCSPAFIAQFVQI